jgi:hypothetical protein
MLGARRAPELAARRAPEKEKAGGNPAFSVRTVTIRQPLSRQALARG